MTLDHLLALQSVGAQILDVREPAEFAAAHLAGSINIGLGGQFATWAGTVLSRDKPIVIIADPGREHEAATRLGRIGFDHVAGYLEDGLASLESRPDLTVHTERLSAQVAAERTAGGAPNALPFVVDIRTPREREEKRIERKHRHPAQPPGRATGGASDRPAPARLLRGRLSLVDRRESPAAPRIHEGQRDCRRHHRVGSRQAPGGDGRRRLTWTPAVGDTTGSFHCPTISVTMDTMGRWARWGLPAQEPLTPESAENTRQSLFLCVPGELSGERLLAETEDGRKESSPNSSCPSSHRLHRDEIV